MGESERPLDRNTASGILQIAHSLAFHDQKFVSIFNYAFDPSMEGGIVDDWLVWLLQKRRKAKDQKIEWSVCMNTALVSINQSTHTHIHTDTYTAAFCLNSAQPPAIWPFPPALSFIHLTPFHHTYRGKREDYFYTEGAEMSHHSAAPHHHHQPPWKTSR